MLVLWLLGLLAWVFTCFDGWWLSGFSFVLGGRDFVCRCFVVAVLGSGLECCWMESLWVISCWRLVGFIVNVSLRGLGCYFD